MKISAFTFLIGLGCIFISTQAYAQTFPIETGTDVDLDNDAGYLRLGTLDGINMVLDENEIQARIDGNASSLFLNIEGGNVTMGTPDDLILMAGYSKLGAGAPWIKTALITGTAGLNQFSISYTTQVPDGDRIIQAFLLTSSTGSAWVSQSTDTFAFGSGGVLMPSAIPNGTMYRLFVTYIN